jgi:SAM-dependent methyltransferase
MPKQAPSADREWRLGRLAAVIRERGLLRGGGYLVATLCKQLAGYTYHQLIPMGTFTFEGEVYPYLVHPHNFTWENERAVELPIASRALLQAQANGARVLEVGNVLSHYGRVRHDILDKYEEAPGLIHADVVDYCPPHRYDFIVSVSTLEHVGWDEQPRVAEKAELAIRHLREILTPDGHLLVTVPIGHNPHLDRLFAEHRAPFDRVSFLQRESARNRWAEVEAHAVREARPWHEHRSSTVIAVGSAGPA